MYYMTDLAIHKTFSFSEASKHSAYSMLLASAGSDGIMLKSPYKRFNYNIIDSPILELF